MCYILSRQNLTCAENEMTLAWCICLFIYLNLFLLLVDSGFKKLNGEGDSSQLKLHPPKICNVAECFDCPFLKSHSGYHEMHC